MFYCTMCRFPRGCEYNKWPSIYAKNMAARLVSRGHNACSAPLKQACESSEGGCQLWSSNLPVWANRLQSSFDYPHTWKNRKMDTFFSCILQLLYAVMCASLRGGRREVSFSTLMPVYAGGRLKTNTCKYANDAVLAYTGVAFPFPHFSMLM